MPIEDKVRRAQQERKRASRTTLDKDGLVKMDQKIWGPDDSNELKLKTMIKGHCGSACHRTKVDADNIVCRKLEWRYIKRPVREFSQEGLPFIVSRTGKRVAQPLTTALHGQQPNEVVYMSFPHTENSNKDNL